MITFPHCKINLGLFVTEKRSDDYHNIESVFLPVALCDVLEVIPASHHEVRLTLSGMALEGSVEDNLCVKAWELLHGDFAIPGIDAHLHKHIPSGAGLGGGSSDGAYMLRMLDEMFGLKQTRDQLKVYAARLGSDCPFFISNQPAFVSGVGDEIEFMEPMLSGKTIVIIHPRIHMSTPEAFTLIQPRSAPLNLRTLPDLPVSQWKDRLTNDFEKPVSELHPVIAEIRDALYAHNALFAGMSGSGSAVYGIFENEMPDLEAAFSRYFYWQGRL